MKRSLLLVLIACSIFGFTGFAHFTSDPPQVSRSNSDDYNEECKNEGCDTEELAELYASYESECLEETCDVEEVREMAGRRDAINEMLQAFQSKGWTVSRCDFVGPCVYSPGNNSTSGDLAFGAFCTQSSINQHWEDFDFDKGDWDEGFGYDDPCNINQPLARTFNALNLLDFFGTSKPSNSNNWLPWFYSFASGAIDELDARCGSGDPNGCTFATTQHGPVIDNWTQLYWPFFYGLNVPARASTIVHEARHADGKSHNGGSGCPRGSSCDTTWGYNGADTYQVLYLWWVRAAGSGLSSATRSQAQTRGNTVLAGGFNTRPTNSAVLGPSASNPTAPFSIP